MPFTYTFAEAMKADILSFAIILEKYTASFMEYCFLVAMHLMV